MTRFRMIEPGSQVVVAVSGGPDSVALLNILHSLRPDLNCTLVVAHLDHGLRPESSEEAAFVADMASELKLPVQVERADVRELSVHWGISVEEAGRRARYDFFERIRESAGAAVIATAHHRNDDLETFFLRIFRGSSLGGLGGIPPARDSIIRPLIRITRMAILDFLNEQGLPYKTDETNLHWDTDRNFVRNRLLPVVAERFPNFAAPLKRTMDLIKHENRFVEQEAERLAQDTVLERDGVACVDLTRLLTASEVLRSRVILQTLYRISGPDFRWARVHVEAVSNIATSRNPSARVDLPGGLLVRREYDRLVFEPDSIMNHEGKPAGRVSNSVPTQPAYRIMVNGPGAVNIPQAGITLVFRLIDPAPALPDLRPDASAVTFDADQMPFPFILRPPLAGDRFSPWGLEGTKKLKKALIDAKMPLKRRRTLPLLVKDDAIIWIPRVRRGSAAPVTPDTKRVLEVEARD